VTHVQTVYTPERKPTGRITDFEPGIADALAAETQAAKVTSYRRRRSGSDDGGMRPDPDDRPVLPEQSDEETGIGWSEAPEPDDDERLRQDRPPHWDQ
jgi:hypothetical protein